MLRLLIRDITVTKGQEPKLLRLHIRWQGGAIETVELRLSPNRAEAVRYDEQADRVGQADETMIDPAKRSRQDQEDCDKIEGRWHGGLKLNLENRALRLDEEALDVEKSRFNSQLQRGDILLHLG